MSEPTDSETGIGARLIALCVRAYPREVRDPFGQELYRATVARWSEARARGAAAALRWWVGEGRALAWGAVQERFERATGRGAIGPRARATRSGRWGAAFAEVQWLLREMRRNLRFSSSLVLVLTLALSLATAIFAFADGVLLKPLRYTDSDRLVAIWANRPAEGLDRVPLTQWDIQRFIDQDDVFEAVGGFTQQRTPMQLSDGVIEIGFGWLTSSIHDVLSVQPIMGRTFTVEDRGELVALLDHGFWQRQFGGDPDILGRTMRIAQQTWTIVGVLPPDTPLELPSRGRVPQRTDVWSTMWVDGSDPDATSAWIRTVARLAPGVTLEQARATALRIAEDSQGLYPERAEAGFELTVDTLRSDFTAGISRKLWLLLAGTIVLLLAAVTNAGNLIVLHHERRRRRTAIRLAVGASRARLATSAWIEAGGFTAIALALALFLSRVVLVALLSSTPSDVPRLDIVQLDTRALVFLGAAGVVTACLLGALSMIWTLKVPVDDVVRQSRTRTSFWSGSSLVSAEVAFAMPLLIVGALLGRSALAMAEIHPGFEAESAVAIRLGLPNHEISRVELYEILSDFHGRIAALPGVETVGAANVVPLAGGAFTGPVALSLAALDGAGIIEGDYRLVTPGYLRSLGVGLVEGQWPRSSDPENTVLVDELMAARLWPGRSALGRTLAARPLGDRRGDFTVAGVVTATRHENLREPGRPTVYFTAPSYTIPYMTTVVRGQVAAATLFNTARRIGAETHVDLLVADARDLGSLVGSANAQSRWLLTMVLALAAGACLITALGLYAVVGQYISSYLPALGIRRALGARPVHLITLVLGRVASIVAAGLIIGVVVALAASRYIQGELFGVRPTDPVTWVLAGTLLGMLALIAILLPTRRAITVSPLEVLRSE